MKKSPVITKVESKVPLLTTAVENQLSRLHPPDKCSKKNAKINGNLFLHDFVNINWCSEVLTVKGTVEISFSTRRASYHKYVSMPVATRFWIVCTKENAENFKATWSCSLS